MQANPLISISYVSKATQDMGMLSLMRLIGQAVSLNKEINATGVLFYENQCFGQILEGPRSEIMGLWAKIQLDPRHHEVRMIAMEEIKERIFPNWSMRFVGADQIARRSSELRDVLDGLPENDHALLKIMRSARELK